MWGLETPRDKLWRTISEYKSSYGTFTTFESRIFAQIFIVTKIFPF